MIGRVVGEPRRVVVAVENRRGISVRYGERTSRTAERTDGSVRCVQGGTLFMLQPKAPQPSQVAQPLPDQPLLDQQTGASASPQTRRHRSTSCPATLVVHSRTHSVRFRILVAPTRTDVPVSTSQFQVPVSFIPVHRM